LLIGLYLAWVLKDFRWALWLSWPLWGWAIGIATKYLHVSKIIKRTVLLIGCLIIGGVLLGLDKNYSPRATVAVVATVTPTPVPSVLPASTPTELPIIPPRPGRGPGPRPTPHIPSKDDVQVISLETNQNITASNSSAVSVFILDFTLTIDRPYQTTTWDLGFEIPAEHTQAHPFRKGEAQPPILHTIELVNEALDTELELAKAQFGPQCISLIAMYEFDTKLIQMMDFYAKNQKRAGAYREKSVLRFRFSGAKETASKDVPVFVLPAWQDGCSAGVGRK
jgi:hypothetical protein